MAAASQAPVAQLDRVSVFETEGWGSNPSGRANKIKYLTQLHIKRRRLVARFNNFERI